MGDKLDHFEVLGEIEGEEPFDSDEVGDDVKVNELVAVLENEFVGDKLEVAVPDADGVVEDVGEEEDVIDIVTLSVLLGDIGALGLLLVLAPRDRLDVGL